MPSNCALTGVKRSRGLGGMEIVSGGCGIGQGPGGAYDTASMNMDLSNWYKATSYPIVLMGSKSGYSVSHDQGTAGGGLAKVYYNDLTGANTNAVQGEVVNGTNVDLNVPFIAIGLPY